MADLWRRLAAYAAAPDPRAAAANAIALLVAANQPFYPLYIHAWVGDDGWVSAYTFLSTPFFLAVPALARRSSLAARVLLPLAGVANTLISAKAFGAASGVELFLCPCALIAGMAFSSRERWATLGLIGLSLAAFLALHDRFGAPLHEFTSAQYLRLLTLNVWSAAGLCAFAALRFSAAIGEAAGEK